MNMLALLLPAVLTATPLGAVIIRGDRPDSDYRVPEDSFSPLVDLPGQGHGVLIADRWVVTVTHSVLGEDIPSVMIAGQPRQVARIVSHPGYASVPQELMTGDAAPAVSFLENTHDISLIELRRPVGDVAPARILSTAPVPNALLTFYGKGATGNGVTGQDDASPRRGPLRRARNRLTGAMDRWLTYRFDCGVGADELEGVAGSGDSGGPVLIEKDDGLHLAALVDWKAWEGDMADFADGVCGQTFYNVRLAFYLPWIEAVISGAHGPTGSLDPRHKGEGDGGN